MTPILWRRIIGYDGVYEVSNQGQIRSIDRVAYSNNNIRKIRGRVLKQRLNKYGYLMVDLSRESITKTLLVHRLVALAFLPIEEGKSCVNHINANKQDNNLQNLEFVSYKENIQHAVNLRLYSRYKMVVNECTGKIYHSIADASINESISYSKLKRIFKNNETFSCLKLVA